MPGVFIYFSVLFPMLAGLLTFVFKFDSDRRRNIYIEAGVIINTIVVFLLLFTPPEGTYILFRLTY